MVSVASGVRYFIIVIFGFVHFSFSVFCLQFI